MRMSLGDPENQRLRLDSDPPSLDVWLSSDFTPQAPHANNKLPLLVLHTACTRSSVWHVDWFISRVKTLLLELDFVCNTKV